MWEQWWGLLASRRGQAWTGHSFLSNSSPVSSARPFLASGEVAELAPQAQEGKMNSHLLTTLPSHKPVCFGYIEKFKPFFAAFKTAGCDDLASRGRFAEGPRKREITRKL